MKKASVFPKKILGFTLIELIFVIAIAAVLATLGLSTVQKRSQQAKIEKTALQMQQLLQAGFLYFKENNCWPGAISGCKNLPPPAFATFNYIPANGTANPWGFRYGWGQTVSGQFEVWGETPDPNADNPPIAQRIAGMLPNSGTGPHVTVVNNGCVNAEGSQLKNCVYARISSEQQMAPLPIYVAAAGTLGGPVPNDIGVKTGVFSCQSGYDFSTIYLSVRDYTIPKEFESYEGDSSFTSASIIKFAFNYARQIVTGGYVYYIALNCSKYDTSIKRLYSWAFGLGVSRLDFFSAAKDTLKHPKAFSSYVINYTIYCCKNKTVCPGATKF